MSTDDDDDRLPRLSAPATRALTAAGYSRLRDLDGASRAEIAALHGMGPKALGVLTEALTSRGFALR
ncbi:MAG: DNA-binding protein [Micrococcales bacterium]|nr:DNA-binding protein [Micrococcales bacterium]